MGVSCLTLCELLILEGDLTNFSNKEVKKKEAVKDTYRHTQFTHEKIGNNKTFNKTIRIGQHGVNDL